MKELEVVKEEYTLDNRFRIQTLMIFYSLCREDELRGNLEVLMGEFFRMLDLKKTCTRELQMFTVVLVSVSFQEGKTSVI